MWSCSAGDLCTLLGKSSFQMDVQLTCGPVERKKRVSLFHSPPGAVSVLSATLWLRGNFKNSSRSFQRWYNPHTRKLPAVKKDAPLFGFPRFILCLIHEVDWQHRYALLAALSHYRYRTDSTIRRFESFVSRPFVRRSHLCCHPANLSNKCKRATARV